MTTGFSESRLLILQDEYKTAKKNLRRSITEAKARAWSELLLLIDEDPWGLPFKIVTGS